MDGVGRVKVHIRAGCNIVVCHPRVGALTREECKIRMTTMIYAVSSEGV